VYETRVVAGVKIPGVSVVLSVVVCALGCSPAKSGAPAPHLSDAQLHDEGAIPNVQLARYAKVPMKDYRQELELTVKEGVSGKGFTGRGLLAVRPRQALRMIMLGPGGATAMDVWIAGERWRVSIPSMDKILRGDESTKEMPRGIPVPLLRRWVVEPFGGVPVAVHRGCVAKDGAVVECSPGAFVAFLRRGDVFEVRERDGNPLDLRGRAWWLRDGSVTAWLEGSEQWLKEDENEAVVTRKVHYVSTDPPMTVDVTAGAARMATLPSATFDDPDAVH
jgi:hypothetical protein